MMMPNSQRPLPTTSEGWLIQISGDVAALSEKLGGKIDQLIDGAVKIDGRLDLMEAWRYRVSEDVDAIPKLLEWKQYTQGAIRGIVLVSGIVGFLMGVIGGVLSGMSNIAGMLGGKHP